LHSDQQPVPLDDGAAALVTKPRVPATIMIYAKLGDLDEISEVDPQSARGRKRRRYAIPTEETDVDRAAELRRKQAQAMLDLFEGDRRRAAVTLEELREWASAQYEDHLQFRVNRHLEYQRVIRRMASRAGPASPRTPPVFEWCASSAMAQRNAALDAAAFALEVEIATIIRQAGVVSHNITNDADQRERRPWWRCLVAAKPAELPFEQPTRFRFVLISRPPTQ
jgi:hypothetical protein